jgi:hypothetical protein
MLTPMLHQFLKTPDGQAAVWAVRTGHIRQTSPHRL